MANEQKLTTLGQMKDFAVMQDARDDEQDRKIENHGHSAATAGAAGFMSASDKAKLDGIASGANAYSHPSTHPASMITGLAKVATSGSYNDLSNKPTIPAAVTVDSALSSSSTNPVQNKVVQSALAGKETSGAAATALTNAKAYTDQKIASLINSAPTTLDTLGEIATAMAENTEVVDALEAAIGKKADADHDHTSITNTEIDTLMG